MTHVFDPPKIDSVTKSPQHGSVRSQNKTNSRPYFPQGKYYNSMQEFDQHCICPLT